MRRKHAAVLIAAALLAASRAGGQEGDPRDFGLEVERLLATSVPRLLGLARPLSRPAGAGDYVPREAARADQRVLLAAGLRARFVSRRVAARGDQIAPWPDSLHPTHLLVCIEQARSGRTPAGHGGLNSSLQRVEITGGRVATVLYGMSHCDGIRTTPWGTVLATEEAGDGRAYEILEPLTTTGHWVADRSTGDVRTAVDGPIPSRKVVVREALPTMAWEGLAILPGGALVAGDELRPGAGEQDSDGGALFKFVPDRPWEGGQPIADLAASPLAAGRLYALQVSCVGVDSGAFPVYGQGCEVGAAAWVSVAAATARADAAAHGATGYERPEDLDVDRRHPDPGTRFCWSDTGDETASHSAEVMCVVDPVPVPNPAGERVVPSTGFRYLTEGDRFATATVTRFLQGGRRRNSFDNLAFQPSTGVLYVVEDHPFGEVWACLPDGADDDLAADGCVPVLAVTDPQAEPTGWLFTGDGGTAYLMIQHGESPPSLLDFVSNRLDGRTDDLLEITGFFRRRED